MTVRAFLRDPLLHFLLAGLALFLLYGLMSPDGGESRRVVITQAQIDGLVRQHQAAWNRPPTQAELAGLVETHVRDEILYREGSALGLDQDDPVIKRRVRQKYELIAEEHGRTAPTDAELLAYLKANAAVFAQPAVVSFDQIYFDPLAATPEEVGAARLQLEKGADPVGFGKASLLPRSANDVSLQLVSKDFGAGFARQLERLPIGQWAGPLPSGIGVHLVRVRARQTAPPPPLDQVRQAVAREWENEQRIRSRNASYGRLRSQYEVVIDRAEAE